MFSIELCAGAGGQALGLEQAGFNHLALVEIDATACSTLRTNRPFWNVIEGDLHDFSGKEYQGIDLVAGGVPCPPFSKAGKQLGEKDDRDLFPEALRIIEEIRPKAVMLENVRGLLDAIFDDYRNQIIHTICKLGYVVDWKLLNASDFGVPQLRPRVVIVAIRNDLEIDFNWPKPNELCPPTVGEALYDLMAEKGWKLVDKWREQANDIAPTIVGGSKKHGGPDLGPTRAKRAWATLGIDGHGIADEPPGPDFVGMPRLTNRMVARLQGFPDSWSFCGKKTSVYRQIGNAFPPPVAQAVGLQIRKCLEKSIKTKLKRINVS
ncbi:DNA cytosine methyltransferase [Carboxydocella sp. ULO1]|uniref:DNA cytosine methyltransferase n=1 Tax=Carboxydocella sp. ULO1 TaxID=1926599 RepID=UPI0009ACAFF0|nr:DNA cytosine methyltransferase [Carboxydocella sp. ULO1]GAW28951.1 DNA (cytosine-5-)-methyltransferase [Carboxydocella sp. ULO1]